jgi:adenosylcobyric acid synthase
MGVSGTLLIAGTASDVGKTVVVAGLCRWLARRGVSVAPFKAQNMSLNSFVTRDGEEIGRAQAAQAFAAGIEPEAAMNPILLKPGSDTRSQVVVMGKPIGERDATTYWRDQACLLDTVVSAYRDLRRRFDVVICEGAGSLAEINLRATDIVNMGFARAVDAPTVLVGDIDRGGVFASFVGSVAVLAPEDQALVQGFIVNRFRGDPALLQPGLDMLRDLTGRSTLGVLPYVHGLAMDAEDALDQMSYRDPAPPIGGDVLRVAVLRLPRMSNFTDLDAFAAEPGVVVRFVTLPEELADADLAVIPGTRATVEDLRWLRSRGLDSALRRRAVDGQPVLGICGGYQMLGTEIEDHVESGVGMVAGLRLLPARTHFGANKILDRPQRELEGGSVVEGYEIHHGVVTRQGGEPFFADEGCRVGSVVGTVWHGLFEHDGFRRRYLTGVAAQTGRDFLPAADTCFAAVRERRLEALGDLVEKNLDFEEVWSLIENGPRPGQPVLSLLLTNR